MPKDRKQQKQCKNFTLQEIIDCVVEHSLKENRLSPQKNVRSSPLKENRLPPQKNGCLSLLKERNSLPSFNAAFGQRFYRTSIPLSSSSNEENKENEASCHSIYLKR